VTAAGSEITLATLSERLDGLSDLFKRRLLDDRAKQVVIEDLQARLTSAERAISAATLRPLVDGLSLVIDRLVGADPTADLRDSLIDELEDVIESLGVRRIGADTGDPVDRLRHEVTSASGDGSELRVGHLVRTGYEKDGVVLRPAKITAVWATASEPANGPSGDGHG